MWFFSDSPDPPATRSLATSIEAFRLRVSPTGPSTLFAPSERAKGVVRVPDRIRLVLKHLDLECPSRCPGRDKARPLRNDERLQDQPVNMRMNWTKGHRRVVQSLREPSQICHVTQVGLSSSCGTHENVRTLRIADVRRCLVLLLLLLISYQVVWAGAAQYCVHEEDPGVTHFGHHGHKHHSASGEQASGAVGSDADCSACHLASAAVLPGAALLVGAISLSEGYSYVEPRYPFRVPDGPERPQRATPRPAVRFGSGVLSTSLT